MARGLQPLLGLSFIWNVDAQVGANANTDPPLPSGYPWVASIWAGGPGNINPLEADYMWMYDDGFGGSNIDCETAGASGCWVHRESILSVGSCTTCLMGAGYAVVGGAPSMGASSWSRTGPPRRWRSRGPTTCRRTSGRGAPPAPIAAKTASSGTGGYREVAARRRALLLLRSL